MNGRHDSNQAHFESQKGILMGSKSETASFVQYVLPVYRVHYELPFCQNANFRNHMLTVR